jgi:hypothetical protein
MDGIKRTSESVEPETQAVVSKNLLSNTLSILGWISFFLLCIAFPLVGPSGSRVPHAAKNRMVFTMVLLMTLLFSGGALFLRLQLRKVDREHAPPLLAPALLVVICLAIFGVLMVNGFAI